MKITSARIFGFVFFAAFFRVPHYYAQVSRDLEYYLNAGAANHPQFFDYINRIKSGKIDSLKIDASQKPQINLNSQILIAPSSKYVGYDDAITNGGNYSSLVGISQPMFNQKTLKPQYESIRTENQSTNLLTQIDEHQLKKQITDQYISTFSDRGDIIYLQGLDKLLAEEDTILKQLVSAGLCKQTDYISLKLERKANEIRISEAENQYLSDLRQLNLLCGIKDTVHYILSDPGIVKSELKSPQNSPLNEQFTIDSLRLAVQKSSVDVRYLPRLNWFADAGFLSASPLTIPKHFGVSAGINLVVPLYDGKQKGMDYQKIKISDETRTRYQQYFISQYNLQLSVLDEEIISNESRLSAVNEQIELSQSLIAAEKIQMNRGDLSVLTFILALRDQVEMRKDKYNIQLKKMKLINEWNYANW